ncbi:hypothetical protein FPQ18DRAFT_96038 [Pyronema domesticum]|nr:hypothetical protein FPQ18DRAFT_96038 [Pyronema domesticum]
MHCAFLFGFSLAHLFFFLDTLLGGLGFWLRKKWRGMSECVHVFSIFLMYILWLVVGWSGVYKRCEGIPLCACVFYFSYVYTLAGCGLEWSVQTV